MPDISLGHNCFGIDTKCTATKTKINKWNYIKPKSFCIAKDTIKK
jgi:hypothetical protein